MKLLLKPLEVPFMVGDTVWVAQPYDEETRHPYFQGTIIQIFLDGSLVSTTVIRERKEIHELVVSQAVYDLKPAGEYDGMPRVTIEVPLLPLRNILFTSEAELLNHLKERDSLADAC